MSSRCPSSMPIATFYGLSARGVAQYRVYEASIRIRGLGRYFVPYSEAVKLSDLDSDVSWTSNRQGDRLKGAGCLAIGVAGWFLLRDPLFLEAVSAFPPIERILSFPAHSRELALILNCFVFYGVMHLVSGCITIHCVTFPGRRPVDVCSFRYNSPRLLRFADLLISRIKAGVRGG